MARKNDKGLEFTRGDTRKDTGYTFDTNQLKEQRNLINDINDQLEQMNAGSEQYEKSLVKQNQNFAAILEEKRKIAGTDIGGEDFQDLVKTVSKLKDGNQSITDIQAQEAKFRAQGKGDIADLYAIELKRLRTQEVSKRALGVADQLTGGMASKAKSSLSFFKKMGPGAAGAAVGVGLIGAAVGLLIKALKFASEIIDSVGQQFGSIVGTSQEFRDNMLDASVDVISLGKGTADVNTVVDELSKNFGIALDTASELPNKVLDTAVAVGLTTEEGAKLFGTLMSIADLSLDQAEALAESTYQLAQQNNVNPAAVMSDIAGSAEMIAKFGAENVDSLAEAAVKARQLGLNLATVDKIADSLLNFQSSLTAEIEASAFVGKRLNFQKARELALTGKSSEMMDEVLSQLGDEADLVLDNVLARKALAASVGVEVAEMERLLNAQDKSFAAAKSFSDLAGADAMSSLTTIMNEIKEIGATFLRELGGPLAEHLKDFRKSFFTEERIESLKAFASDFANVMVRVLETATSIFNVFGGISSTLSGIYDIVTHPIVAGLIGLGFGGGLGAIAAVGASLMVNDFKSSGGSHLVVTPMGRVLQTNPNDTVFGSTKVNDFASGPEGSLSINGGGNNAEMINEIRRLTDAVNAQTGVIKKAPDQTAERLRGR